MSLPNLKSRRKRVSVSDKRVAHVVSFADSLIYRSTHFRLMSQIKKFSNISSFTLATEASLSAPFRRQFASRLVARSRGFGYWCWKPEVIRAGLERLNEGEILVYADAGCHFNAQAESQLGRWIDSLLEGGNSILAWSLEHPEYMYTKDSLRDHLGIKKDSNQWISNQISASVLILRKTESTSALVEQWGDVFKTDFELIDDSPSSGNHRDFIEHRHDQSLLSLLLKDRFVGQTSLLDIREQFPLNGLWRSLKRSPIHIRRDWRAS